MRTRPVLGLCVLLAGVSCRSVVALPPADAIVEGRVADTVPVDTIDDVQTIGIARGKYSPRRMRPATQDFWGDVAVLDMVSADAAARTLDQFTFAVALKQLLAGDAESAAIAFNALRATATDTTIRARARIGLTMALSWQSDWLALSRLASDRDSAANATLEDAPAAVERWGRALANVPPMRFAVPFEPITLPMRRSAFGTPVVTVRLNGVAHDFWLDTGASLTLLSDEVALASHVKLSSRDTLALGVVAGVIEARAVYIDSLAIGSVVAYGLGAALVSRNALRMDRRVVDGRSEAVIIDGVIGTDFLRGIDIVIDAQAGTITLSRPHVQPHSTRNLFWVGYPVVRLVSESGRPLLFGLDTGAEGTYVTTTLLRKQPDMRVAMRRGSIRGLGSEEHRTEWVARSLAMSDGDYVIRVQNAPVAPERKWTFVTLDGVLGADVALTSRMHLDFTNGVFDIRRSASTLPNAPTVTIGH
ncbi:MAG: retroviral-like aspartic protease family protein [Gemmatimonadota bacterium]|nr:retroviral-like aspartic protease family protein [Gemmatimonadota bacterium]